MCLQLGTSATCSAWASLKVSNQLQHNSENLSDSLVAMQCDIAYRFASIGAIIA